jgi:nucleoside-diphosphate-sugar epimerase
MCQGYARVYKLNISIARPYSLYGKYEKPHRLFPRLWKAFYLNQPMKLYRGFHDFIHINDFIRGIDILLQKDDKPLGDIVNFGSGVQYSNTEVFSLFEKIIGKPAPVELIDQMVKVYENDIWICDTSYSRDVYGFKVNYDLETGIKQFLKTANYN